MSDAGWKSGKFVVKHYRRGDLLDGEAFVLVPERDPAALQALSAYADATPDPKLSAELWDWIERCGGSSRDKATIDDKLPSWVRTLADEVRGGDLSIEHALYRLARYVRSTDAMPQVRI